MYKVPTVKTFICIIFPIRVIPTIHTVGLSQEKDIFLVSIDSYNIISFNGLSTLFVILISAANGDVLCTFTAVIKVKVSDCDGNKRSRASSPLIPVISVLHVKSHLHVKWDFSFILSRINIQGGLFLL